MVRGSCGSEESTSLIGGSIVLESEYSHSLSRFEGWSEFDIVDDAVGENKVGWYMMLVFGKCEGPQWQPSL